MDTIIITFEDGSKKEYKKGIKLQEIIDDVKDKYSYDIICGKFRGQQIYHQDIILKSGDLILYDINNKHGNKIYERGLLFLFETCVLDILGKDTKIIIKFSVDHGIFCEIDKQLSLENIEQIKNLMKEKVKKGIPFQKIETSKMEAINYFRNIKREDKVKALFYDTSNFVTLYKFDGIYNYILGSLPYDSSVLKYFDLTLIENKGIVVRFPSIYDDGKVRKYIHHEKYFNSLEEYYSWGKLLNIGNIGELNEAVINNDAGEIIQLSEMLQDYKLLNIAEGVSLNRDDYKIVLISGPSSSGKTTTAMKLSLYLKTLGLNPTYLSMDDYFLNREDTPLGIGGKPDYESLAALDIKLLDNQIAKLLKGLKVTIPTFNFITGKKEFNKTIQMHDNDILIIEGLHALNDSILSNINKKNKLKIYASPLTYLNLDNDNRINMTDIRLLRRIVRDNRTRGYSPSHTLSTWSDVRQGEQKYVFTFQDEADIVFNTALVYELGVLKTYVEPLLFSVKETDSEYPTAVRLLELLKFVLPIPSDDIPKTSIFREFIGESYFDK